MSCNCECNVGSRVDCQTGVVITRPRYHVSASRSDYVSESYDDLTDAINRAAELAQEGFGSVNIRDNQAQESSW